MIKWADFAEIADKDLCIASGMYPKTVASGMQSMARTSAETEPSPHSNLIELWQTVAYWIARMDPRDPRRRLLELAQLRHDAMLAGAVLRHL